MEVVYQRSGMSKKGTDDNLVTTFYRSVDVAY